MKWAEQELCGWGRYPKVRSLVAKPSARAEFCTSVDECRALAEQGEDRSGLLAHGCGRSYGDAALLRDGRVVLTRRLDRMLEFDPATGRLRCEAGVSLEQLLRIFLPRGFFPPVLPGTKFVSVGGAIANDIHGKNHHVDGTFSDHVTSFELLLASGEVISVSREDAAELFQATVGGLGLTGMILSAEMTLTPVEGPWIETESFRVGDLDEFLQISSESGGYTHTVSWIDCLAKGKRLGRGLFLRGRHAVGGRSGRRGLLGKLPLSVPLDVPGFVLNPLSLRLFNEVYFRKQWRRRSSAVVHYEPWFFPLDSIGHWNRAYGRRGMIQYQLVVPQDPQHQAIRAVIERIARSGMGSFLAVIKEFGPNDHGGLSFPMPGITLALDFPNYGKTLLQLLDELDRIVVEAGGRVYLGKDARLSRDMFQQMYPGWMEWKEVRDRFDPQGLFHSDLGHRLSLVDEGSGSVARAVA